jgi:hypothetical protein
MGRPLERRVKPGRRARIACKGVAGCRRGEPRMWVGCRMDRGVPAAPLRSRGFHLQLLVYSQYLTASTGRRAAGARAGAATAWPQYPRARDVIDVEPGDQSTTYDRCSGGEGALINQRAYNISGPPSSPPVRLRSAGAVRRRIRRRALSVRPDAGSARVRAGPRGEPGRARTCAGLWRRRGLPAPAIRASLRRRAISGTIICQHMQGSARQKGQPASCFTIKRKSM